MKPYYLELKENQLPNSKDATVLENQRFFFRNENKVKNFREKNLRVQKLNLEKQERRGDLKFQRDLQVSDKSPQNQTGNNLLARYGEAISQDGHKLRSISFGGFLDHINTKCVQIAKSTTDEGVFSDANFLNAPNEDLNAPVTLPTKPSPVVKRKVHFSSSSRSSGTKTDKLIQPLSNERKRSLNNTAGCWNLPISSPNQAIHQTRNETDASDSDLNNILMYSSSKKNESPRNYGSERNLYERYLSNKISVPPALTTRKNDHAKHVSVGQGSSPRILTLGTNLSDKSAHLIDQILQLSKKESQNIAPSPYFDTLESSVDKNVPPRLPKKLLTTKPSIQKSARIPPLSNSNLDLKRINFLEISNSMSMTREGETSSNLPWIPFKTDYSFNALPKQESHPQFSLCRENSIGNQSVETKPVDQNHYDSVEENNHRVPDEIIQSSHSNPPQALPRDKRSFKKHMSQTNSDFGLKTPKDPKNSQPIKKLPSLSEANNRLPSLNAISPKVKEVSIPEELKKGTPIAESQRIQNINIRKTRVSSSSQKRNFKQDTDYAILIGPWDQERTSVAGSIFECY